MNITLLLDLDGTLLGNDMDRFAQVYMQALANYMVTSGMIEESQQKNFAKVLWAATQKMIENNYPGVTLKETFDASFYPVFGIDQEKAKAIIDQFYAQIFPTLKYVTEYRPEAVALIKEAIKRGYRLAIATNPLFPRVATLHRLAWAGFPAEDHPFEVISSYEDFHFAKPNTAYFAELLARMNWPEGPVVMVGNDPFDDIAGAKSLGLPTFQVIDENFPEAAQSYPSGQLKDLIPWLDTNSNDKLQPDYARPEAMLATLRSTPAALLTISQEVSLNQWDQRLRPNEWALNEILCHLRDVDAEVNLPRLQKFTQESNPFIPAAITDPWAEERQYIHQDGLQALHDFLGNRLQILTLLDSLTAEGWQSPARHTIFGPTTLAEMVGITAGHDRLHIQQFTNTLKAIQADI